MKRRTFLKFGTGAAISGTLAACGGGRGDTDPPPLAAPQVKAVAGWTRTALQAVRTVKSGPPMVARSLAVLHTCMYNAWTAFDDSARATHGQAIKLAAGERTAASKTAALCQAAYTALVDQFPSQKAAFDAYLASQARLRFRAADHGDPLPVPRAADSRLWAAGAGRRAAHHRRRGLGALPAGHIADAAVSRARVRA